MKPWWMLPPVEMLKFWCVILGALAIAWWLWKKGDKWKAPWQKKEE